MARPLRIEYAGAFYHVMNRGAARKSIFHDPMRDRALFLKTLEEAAHLWKIRVHGYSLMENHYHLLIETPLPNLSRAMRHLDGVFTQRLNRTNGQDGPLFRGRFKSILIEKESYFLELIRYIHLNGVKVAQYPSPAMDPYCSHGEYLGKRKCPTWLVTDLALSFFGPDINSQRGHFDAFVLAGIPKELEAVLARERWPAILGLKTFIEEIRQQFHLRTTPHKEKPQERELILSARPDPDGVLKRVANIFRIEEANLVCRGRKTHSDAKQIAIYVLRYACHLSYGEIGRRLGDIGDSAVLYQLKQVKARPIQAKLRKALKEEFGLNV